MTRIALVLLAATLLSGCGRAPIDPTFDAYVTRFDQAAREQGVPQFNAGAVTIRFAVLQPNGAGDVGGECSWGGDGNKLIQINPNDWNVSSDARKERIMFHELGHCVLDRPHATSTVSGTTTPDSVMVYNADAITDAQWVQDRPQYMQELFNPGHF